jgi:hypothetical protein
VPGAAQFRHLEELMNLEEKMTTPKRGNIPLSIASRASVGSGPFAPFSNSIKPNQT